MIVKNKYIPFGRFKYMAVWPFIFIKKVIPVHKMNHERIHLRQQIEVFLAYLLACSLLALFIPHWIWFLVPFVGYYWVYSVMFFFKGYRNNPMEKEAYDNEKDMFYLRKRKHFAWLRTHKKSF